MSSQNIKDMVVDGALEMAALRDWRDITLADIALASGVELGQMSELFECREDVLEAYAKRVDRDVLAQFPNGVEGADEKERLFDALMERYERLNQDRDAVLSILKTYASDPKQVLSGFPALGRSMTWTLEACGVETSGYKGLIRVGGLMGVFMWGLRAWQKDESPDLAKTMAVLDKALGRVEAVSLRVGL